MTPLSRLRQACEAEVVTHPAGDPDPAIAAAYTSDLLSDVMAHAPEGGVLITVQNHTNTLAVCTLVGLRAVLVCHGREIPEEMRAVAAREGIALLRTRLDQFTASCRAGAALQGGRATAGAAQAPP